jgi:hypothetical protein
LVSDGVVVDQQSQDLFILMVNVTGRQLTKGPESADFANFTAGQEPGNRLPKQVARAADTARFSGKTNFRVQD